jgi:hypothetical protein
VVGSFLHAVLKFWFLRTVGNFMILVGTVCQFLCNDAASCSQLIALLLVWLVGQLVRESASERLSVILPTSDSLS